MFKHRQHTAVYKGCGYLTFPLLNPADTDRCLAVYAEVENYHTSVADKFKGSNSIDDKAVVANINQRLTQILTPALQRVFQNYNSLGCSFLVKEPGADTAVGAHQDWSYVDEATYSSFNVWIALEDMTVQNGSLWVLPGTHLMGNYLRPAPDYPVPFARIKKFIERFRKNIYVKAGDCICFNNRTIHGSAPNMGSKARVVVVTTIYPAQAQLMHYYIHNSKYPQKVTAYNISPQQFFEMRKGNPPDTFLNKKEMVTKYPAYNRVSFLLQWGLCRIKAAIF